MIPATAVANLTHQLVNKLVLCRFLLEEPQVRPPFSPASAASTQTCVEILDTLQQMIMELDSPERRQPILKADAARALHRIAGTIGLARANVELAIDQESNERAIKLLREVDELLAGAGAATADYRAAWLQGPTHTLREAIERSAAAAPLAQIETRVSTDQIFDDLLASRFVREFLDEALLNAIKHGEPEVSIAADRAEQEILITVSDRGPGFDPAGVKEGFGMTTLRESAANLGGGLSVKSNPCTVVLRFPIER